MPAVDRTRCGEVAFFSSLRLGFPASSRAAAMEAPSRPPSSRFSRKKFKNTWEIIDSRWLKRTKPKPKPK